MIGMGCDHAGLELKNKLIKKLKEVGYTINDYGTSESVSVDYPDYAFKVGEGIISKGINRGVLICKTGIGMSIACNKVKGVRCAKVNTVEEAYLTRSHNDANVIAISADLEIEEAFDIVETFIKTEFSNEERHINRINKIKNYEDNYEY